MNCSDTNCRRLFARPFPLFLVFLFWPLRTALLRACSPQVFLLLSAAYLLAPLIPLAPRISLFFSFPFAAAAAHITSPLAPRVSRLSPACSPEHFPLARLPRLAAYLRRPALRVLFVRSFAHFFTRLSLSLRYAQLCFARSARFCSSSCLAFCLFSPRASPLFSSRLDTPHHN